jgi:hypothetical protein
VKTIDDGRVLETIYDGRVMEMLDDDRVLATLDDGQEMETTDDGGAIPTEEILLAKTTTAALPEPWAAIPHIAGQWKYLVRPGHRMHCPEAEARALLTHWYETEQQTGKEYCVNYKGGSWRVVKCRY